MPLSSSQNSSTRYGLIVFLILVFFLCAVFFYIRDKKPRELTKNINELIELNEDYSMIDSCIIVLYNADNNCRLYTLTGKKSYIKKFVSDINFVSSVLDSIKNKVDENAKSESRNLKDLIAQKKTRTVSFLKLRRLTDSLINFSNKIDTSVNKYKIGLDKGITYKQLKTIVTIDTISSAVQTEKRKNLLGRLVDAFANNKDSSRVADTSVKYQRTEIKLDTSLQSQNFNSIQLEKIDAYFNNSYTSNNLLKKNEISILQLNSKIISELVSLLREYKTKEKHFLTQTKNILRTNIGQAVKILDKIFIFSILLLFLLVVAILYNLWKIYRNEHALINYSEKAAQYAVTKSRFLANMSHEIRTPLNSVIGFSEQLSQGYLDNQQIEQVNAIRNSSVMLLDVVNDILDFSKYETGKISFEKTSFTPFDIIIEVFNSVSILATNKGLYFKNEISFDNKICFTGDSRRLKQVLMNLLSNAIKFTDEGSVTLQADITNNSKKQSVLKVKIIDTGVGIDNEDINMIFDEFAQVYYSSTKVKQKGTGLGLAICKKIVEFQNGKILVTSRLGVGSTFSFEIPYEACFIDSIVQNTNTNKNNTYSLEGKRILLADDNKMNILLAQTILKKYKMIVEVAYDGKEAFELYENHLFDLILTDIQMPEMSGVELTYLIRSYHDPEKAKLPILGITANVLEEDRVKYIEAGINDLVLKPYSEKELINKITEYLNFK